MPSGFAPPTTANLSPPPPATVPKLNFGTLAQASTRDDMQRAKSVREAPIKNLGKGGRVDARSSMTPRGTSTAGVWDKEADGLGVLSPRQPVPRFPSVHPLAPTAASKASGSDSSPPQMAAPADASGAYHGFIACDTRSPRSSRSRGSSGRVDYLAMAAAHRELMKGAAAASGEASAAADDAEHRRSEPSQVSASSAVVAEPSPPEQPETVASTRPIARDGADTVLVRGSSGRTPPSVPPVRVRSARRSPLD